MVRPIGYMVPTRCLEGEQYQYGIYSHMYQSVLYLHNFYIYYIFMTITKLTSLYAIWFCSRHHKTRLHIVCHSQPILGTIYISSWYFLYKPFYNNYTRLTTFTLVEMTFIFKKQYTEANVSVEFIKFTNMYTVVSVNR